MLPEFAVCGPPDDAAKSEKVITRKWRNEKRSRLRSDFFYVFQRVHGVNLASLLEIYGKIHLNNNNNNVEHSECRNSRSIDNQIFR